MVSSSFYSKMDFVKRGKNCARWQCTEIKVKFCCLIIRFMICPHIPLKWCKHFILLLQCDTQREEVPWNRIKTMNEKWRGKSSCFPKDFTFPLRLWNFLRQICQWEEREAMLFMLELTWETDKTLLYGSAIPFMYNIWVNRSLHPWPTSSWSLLPRKLWG